MSLKKKAKPVLKKPTLPMSESALPKIHDAWTAEQCVAELRRIAEADPEKVITRNYFRVHARIAESVWSQHFGTFLEFKRASGIILTRQQHQLERQIAKHASVDHYRRMSVDRQDYAEKYLRDSTGRFQTGIFCSDLHDEEIDPFYLRVLIDTVKRVQPNVFSMVGDVFDLAEFGKYTVDPRDWNISAKIKFVHKHIFEAVRKVYDGQMDLLEGNHEARMLRLLADATPALRAVLADIHGMTISKLLGLDEFEINYVAKGDLAAYTERDLKSELVNNYRIYWKCFLAHHFPHARNMGLPGCNGHHHKHQAWPQFSPIYGAYEWHQLGSGHRRSASYAEGEKWHTGFLIEHVDTQTMATVAEYVTIGEFAVVGGKFYKREPHEMIDIPKLFSACK